MTAPNRQPFPAGKQSDEPVSNAEQLPHPLASADLRTAHRWMEPCGSCDAGLPMNCTCPSGDVRNVISALVQEVEDWREMFGAGRLVPPDADTRPAGRCTAPVGAHQHSESCRVPVPTTKETP